MSWSEFKSQYLIRFWKPLPAVIAAGILSTYYFGLTGTFWAVTGEFTRWGGHVMQWFGAHPPQWGYFKIIGLGGPPLTRIDGVRAYGKVSYTHLTGPTIVRGWRWVLVGGRR
ncbi:hypothetical protein ACEE86_16550, partial [Proteus mirabilis]